MRPGLREGAFSPDTPPSWLAIHLASHTAFKQHAAEDEVIEDGADRGPGGTPNSKQSKGHCLLSEVEIFIHSVGTVFLGSCSHAGKCPWLKEALCVLAFKSGCKLPGQAGDHWASKEQQSQWKILVFLVPGPEYAFSSDLCL